MMYMTDRGGSYSDGFYEIRDGKVWNPFTNKSLGTLIRTIPSNNYLCITKEKKIPWHKQIVRWFMETDAAYQREHNVPPEAEGELADTMRGLGKERNEHTTK